MSLKVGQTLYLKSLTHSRKEIETVVISKIGKKYFELEGPKWHRTRFSIDTLLENAGQYTASWQAYISKQEIEDEQEANRLSEELRGWFGFRASLSLDQLRRIKAITLEEKK